MRIVRGVFLALSLAAALPGISYAESTAYDAHTEVELVSSAAAVSPGSEFWAAVRFKPDARWHLYWKNPGDSGLAPKILWELPPGWSAGEIRWPYPHRIDLPPLTSYGYSGEVFLAAPLTVPPSAAAGETAVLAARVTWLACKVECVPGKADLTLNMPIAAAGVPEERTARSLAKTREQWPIVSDQWLVRAAVDGDRLILDAESKDRSLPPLAPMAFFADVPALVRHAQPQAFRQTTKGGRLEVPLSINRPKNLERLEGVLVSAAGWRGPGSEKALAVSVPLETSAPPLLAPPKPSIGAAAALVFAFLGGVLLNLMPCVLPVLSLKVLGFVREASENPRALLGHGLAFAAGVIASFWILAGLLLVLQAAGRQIGWGFQLQSPVFLIVLSFLFFLFALNLFGVFEIGLTWTGAGQPAARRGGFAGSFLSGFFATVVATPCTAPFMGTALGFTLTQGPGMSLAVFTALGAGMAAPYVILCAYPAFLKRVPKPGAWMETLKRVLGLPLLATVVWLAWVLGIQKGPAAVTGLFVGLLTAGAGVLTASKVRLGRWARAAAVFSVLAGMTLAVFAADRSVPAAASGASAHGLAWENYSSERLSQLRAAGKPVFIDFTAAWCLTCKVNERVALDHPQVVEAFRRKGIAPLKADWTSQDEAIARALAGYGRNSIPLYVYYPAGNAEPAILPEILTPAIVLTAIGEEA